MTEGELGRFGEALWGAVFRQSGFGFIPLCRIERGGAPVIEGVDEIVLPDFEVLCQRHAVLLDSKAKRRAVLFRKANEIRHGIDRRLWEHYRRAAQIARKRAGLGVIELWEDDAKTWSGALLVECFPNLGRPFGGFGSQPHMVYWPRKRFVDLDSHPADDLMLLAKGELDVSYRHELEDIFGRPLPPEQQTLF